MLSFEGGYQFLFCGENTLAICGGRFIILSRSEVNKSLIYKIKEDKKKGILCSKSITDIDGIRCLTNKSMFFITPLSDVSKELFQICYPFSQSDTKKLIKEYFNSFSDKYNTNNINDLKPKLNKLIFEILKASADIFWFRDDDDTQEKDMQALLLKVAQFGKNFMDKESFNFLNYVEICKKIRVLNQIRNDKKTPFFITYNEFDGLGVQKLIEILIKYKNFKSADEINKFLDYRMAIISYKYMIEKLKIIIKKADKYIYIPDKSKEKESEEERIYREFIEEVESLQDISYVKLSKKAHKLGNEKLAMKLLDQEKSVLTKIPQLIELNKINLSLNICFETYDINILSIVLNKISKNDDDILLKILCNPELKDNFTKIIFFLRKYKTKLAEKYLEITKNYNELFYFRLEKLFKAKSYKEKKNILDDIKKGSKDCDSKLKKYLENIDISWEFKNDCLEEKIIHISDNDPFSNTIYDCFVNGAKYDKFNWIEKKNKNLDYNTKKLILVKFRGYLEKKNPNLIDSELEKTSLKKLGLTPFNMGELYFDYNLYDKSAEYFLQVKDRHLI